MKRTILILSLILGLVLCACEPLSAPVTDTEVATTEAPKTVVGKPTPTPLYLSDLYELTMFTGGEGWATNVNKDRIYNTQNFGEHFYDVTPPDFASVSGGNSIFTTFANSSTAWVCANTPGANGTLFQTNDAGKTWISSKIDFPCGMMIIPVLGTGYVLSNEDAGMGSQYMSLHKTEDDGASWTEIFRHDPANPQQPGLPTSGVKNQFVSLNKDILLVGGSEPVSGSLYLYRSEDGGASWSQKGCQGLPDSDEAELSPTGITRVNANEAYIAIEAFLPNQENKPTHFCYTSDAGQTWNYLSTLDNVAFSDFGSSQTGVAFSDGKMYQSSDGGKTWVDVSQGLPQAITPVGVDMVSNLYGYLTVSITPDTLIQNRIYMTVDGGGLWKAMPGTILK